MVGIIMNLYVDVSPPLSIDSNGLNIYLLRINF